MAFVILCHMGLYWFVFVFEFKSKFKFEFELNFPALPMGSGLDKTVAWPYIIGQLPCKSMNKRTFQLRWVKGVCTAASKDFKKSIPKGEKGKGKPKEIDGPLPVLTAPLFPWSVSYLSP